VLNTPIAEWKVTIWMGEKGGKRYKPEICVHSFVHNQHPEPKGSNPNLIQQHFEAISLCQIYLMMMEDARHH